MSNDRRPMPPDPLGNGDREPTDALPPTLAELTDGVMALAAQLQMVADAVEQLATTREAEKDEPAEWTWFPAPPIAGFPPETLAAWVVFYNQTYALSARKDEPNPPIPACWTLHPGLATEIATLAAAWRSAFVGPAASAVEAQSWHDRWRPGFAARLRCWASCTERHVGDSHQSPLDRFTLAESTPPRRRMPR